MRTGIIKKPLGRLGLCLASLALVLLMTACGARPVLVEINPATYQPKSTLVARVEATEPSTNVATPPLTANYRC